MLFTLPLAPHQKNTALTVTRALAQRMEGCCKPAPPSPAGPAALCSGHTRQTQSQKDSFGLFATRQDAGVPRLLGLAGPTASPMSPLCRAHPADVTQLGGWAGCISAGCRQGAISCCDARVKTRCHTRVPFCHKPHSTLAFEPHFTATLPPQGMSHLCCEDMLSYRPCRLCGRFEALEVFAKRTAGCFYRLFFVLFFVCLIEILHLTYLTLFFVI